MQQRIEAVMGIEAAKCDGKIFANGTAVPSGKPGFAKGCIFVDTKTGNVYKNTGTLTSCTFTAI